MTTATTPTPTQPPPPTIHRPSNWTDLRGPIPATVVPPISAELRDRLSACYGIVSDIYTLAGAGTRDRSSRLQDLLNAHSPTTWSQLADVHNFAQQLRTNIEANTSSPTITFETLLENLNQSTPGLRLLSITNEHAIFSMDCKLRVSDFVGSSPSDSTIRAEVNYGTTLRGFSDRELTRTDARVLLSSLIDFGTFQVTFNLKPLVGFQSGASILRSIKPIRSTIFNLKVATSMPPGRGMNHELHGLWHPHTTSIISVPTANMPCMDLSRHCTGSISDWCLGSELPMSMAGSCTPDTYYIVPNLVHTYLNTYGHTNPFNHPLNVIINLLRNAASIDRSRLPGVHTALQAVFPEGVPTCFAVFQQPEPISVPASTAASTAPTGSVTTNFFDGQEVRARANGSPFQPRTLADPPTPPPGFYRATVNTDPAGNVSVNIESTTPNGPSITVPINEPVAVENTSPSVYPTWRAASNSQTIPRAQPRPTRPVVPDPSASVRPPARAWDAFDAQAIQPTVAQRPTSPTSPNSAAPSPTTSSQVTYRATTYELNVFCELVAENRRRFTTLRERINRGVPHGQMLQNFRFAARRLVDRANQLGYHPSPSYEAARQDLFNQIASYEYTGTSSLDADWERLVTAQAANRASGVTEALRRQTQLEADIRRGTTFAPPRNSPESGVSETPEFARTWNQVINEISRGVVRASTEGVVLDSVPEAQNPLPDGIQNIRGVVQSSAPITPVTRPAQGNLP